MRDHGKPVVALIGAGPAGLMAAEVLARHDVAVTVYDRMPSPGRKFLLAGRGGLNLTHSEPLEAFIPRYREAAPFLRPFIEAFPPEALRNWCHDLGQETFVGTSGRVFPRAMKASPLLRAWLGRLRELGVVFRPRCQWLGWNEDGALVFASEQGMEKARPAATLLALGGASWPKLGSDGSWAAGLRERGIEVAALVPANCGFVAQWTATFRERFEGAPLNGVALQFGGRSAHGALTITSTGIEGGVVYALSAELRDAIAAEGSAIVTIDLRRSISKDHLAKQLLSAPAKLSLANLLRKIAKLSPPAIGLLHEVMAIDGRKLGELSRQDLAALIKAAPLRLTSTSSIERAISSAGGIRLSEFDENLMMKKMPGVFAAGEMLDWEAPTGGYLLQACFATGRAAGLGMVKWLRDAGLN